MASVRSNQSALDDLNEITKVCDQLIAEQNSSDILTHKNKGENSTESDNVTQENSSTNSHSPQVGLNLPTDNSPTSTKLATEPTSSSTSHTNVPLIQLKSLPTLESDSSLPTSNSSPHTSKIQPGDCSSHIQQENTFSQPGCEPVDKKFTQPVDSCDILQTSQEEAEEEEPQFDSSIDMKTWLNSSVRTLIEHLNRYGVCVVDNFLGDEKGSKLLDEIWRMQKREYFVDGQVMSGGGQHEPAIRNDKITWTDGFAPLNCPYLRYCVKLLDSIVLRANRVKNNGELGKYRLTGRTPIMCACYPGGGSRYVKHVDNPNKDGRVVTAIYYLNKHWDSRVDGGSLKIYSQVNKGKVIQIDPVFDRVVFFWSDARNPHEVLPANKPRFAVTVWYLDAKEKQEHQQRTKAEFQPAQAIRPDSDCDNLNQLKGCQL